MSYYQVFVDGVEIYNPLRKDMTLINPVCSPSLTEAGSADFTMDKSHVAYNSITPYGSDVEIWEDGWPIFYGRPLPPTVDFYGRKKYHVEGIVAFLNDIYIPPLSKMVPVFEDGQTEEDFTDGEEPPQKQRTITAQEYIDYIFETIGNFQTNSNRILLKGSIQLEANPLLLYKETEYKTALDILRQDILPYTGGYLKGRVIGGQKYIDISSSSGTLNQPVKAGVNLLSFQAAQQGFYTACIAKGGPIDGEHNKGNYSLEEPIYMDSSIISQYGVICAYKDFPEAESEAELRSKCNTFLASQQFDGLTFETSVLDLHIVNSSYDRLEIGGTVVFDSPMTGMDKITMLVTGCEIHLDTGEKTVKLGIDNKARLTQNWMSEAKKQGDSYNFDQKPTENSQNILSSGSIYDALHDTDAEPTEGSEKLISSGAVYDALQNEDGWIHQVNGVTQETGTINFVTET